MGSFVTTLAISFGLSTVLIFLAVWLVARYDAEMGSARLVLSAILLFAFEILLNFLWAVMWMGTPGKILLLASVFVPVAVVGLALVNRIHHTSIPQGAGVMGIYVPVKVAFAILVGIGIIGKPGGHSSPNPVSVWMIDEVWKTREVANLRLELPAQPTPNTIPVPPGLKKYGRFDHHSEIDSAGCLILILQITALNQEFDLDGAVAGFVADIRAKTFIEDFFHQVTQTEVDGFPARQVKGDLKDRGRAIRFEILIIASGNTGWILQVLGGKQPVTERAERIFSSIEVTGVPVPVEDPAPDKGKKPKKAPKPDKPLPKSSITAIPIKVKRVVRIAESEVYPIFRRLTPSSTFNSPNPELYILGRTEDQLILAYKGKNGKQFLGNLNSYARTEQKFFSKLPVTHRLGTGSTPAKGRFPVNRTIENAEGVSLEVMITGRTADTVIFRNKQSKEFRYPIDKLNPSDQQFVRSLPVSE